MRQFSEFLAKHNAKNNKNGSITHTRIPDKELNIYAGSYSIPKEEIDTFYKLYYEHVFVNKNKEYLTEKQLESCCPIVVDFDFKYKHDITDRQHTTEQINDIVCVYLDELKEYFNFDNSTSFSVYIFEKPNVNRLADNSLTKDGIHMIIGIQADHIIQTMLREKMLNVLPEYLDLPLINTWDNVLDEGISKGHTNWQLFGSRKPNNEAYELTHHYEINYDISDGNFGMNEKNITDFDLQNNFEKLSIQYDKHPKFEINPKILHEYNKRSSKKNNNSKNTNRPENLSIVARPVSPENEIPTDISRNTNEIPEKFLKFFEYAKLISNKFIGFHVQNRNNRFKFIRAAANLEIPSNLLIKHIMKYVTNYDENNKKYEQSITDIYANPNDDSKGKLGWKTIYLFASKGNPEAKYKLDRKYTDLITQPFTTTLLAEYFNTLYPNRFVFNNDCLYCWNGIYWKKDKKPYTLLNNFFKRDFVTQLKIYANEKLSNETDDEKRKKIAEFVHHTATLRNLQYTKAVYR
jgi:hypothetical protein